MFSFPSLDLTLARGKLDFVQVQEINTPRVGGEEGACEIDRKGTRTDVPKTRQPAACFSSQSLSRVPTTMGGSLGEALRFEVRDGACDLRRERVEQRYPRLDCLLLILAHRAVEWEIDGLLPILAHRVIVTLTINHHRQHILTSLAVNHRR